MTINESSRNAAINWHSFNIGSGKKDSASTVLNRVTGDINALQIGGMLTANGRVSVINPERHLRRISAIGSCAGGVGSQRLTATGN